MLPRFLAGSLLVGGAETDGVIQRLPGAGTAGAGLQREVLADGDPTTGDTAAITDPGGGQEQLVELRQRTDMRDRHQ